MNQRNIFRLHERVIFCRFLTIITDPALPSDYRLNNCTSLILTEMVDSLHLCKLEVLYFILHF